MEIYKITNLINNKIYIGKDCKNDINYYGSGLLIKRSIEKYGIENFKKEILESTEDYKHLSIREKYWIDKLNSRNPSIGYNISPGGDGGDTLSSHPDLELIKKKISKNSKTKGKTYEEAFGEKRAEIYKKRLSNSHPRKNLKDRLGDNYDLWLSNVRDAAKNKKGRSIKDINNWTDGQYNSYIKLLRKRFNETVDNLSKEKIKRIHDKNRERGKKRRIDNIESFIYDIKNKKITKENYRKYNQKIYNWRRDLGDGMYEIISKDIIEEFNIQKGIFKKENIEKRIINFRKKYNHNDISKIKISESKKNTFLKLYKEIKLKIDNNSKITDLSDIFSNKKDREKVRKKLLNSKFSYLIESKYFEVLKSKKSYGNSPKKLIIDGVIYNSVSDSAKSLNIDRSKIRYRLKSNNFKNYSYFDESI